MFPEGLLDQDRRVGEIGSLSLSVQSTVVGEVEIKTTNGNLRKSQGLGCASVGRVFA